MKMFSAVLVSLLGLMGALAPAIRAQQMNVTPAASDVSQRLMSARTWDMPKQPGFVAQKGMVGEKTLRNICNGHPDNHYDYTQEDACSRYMGYIKPGSVDDFMPEFKACALDPSKRECVLLAWNLASHGYYDYAVGLVEDGYSTYEIRVASVPPSPGTPVNLSFYFQAGSLEVYANVGKVGEVDDSQNVSALLKSLCLTQGNPIAQFQSDACQLAQQVGTAVSQQDRAQAAQAQVSGQNLADQKSAAAERRFDQAADASAARSNALNHVADVMTASAQTIAQSSPQPYYAAPVQQPQVQQAAQASTSQTPTLTVIHAPDQSTAQGGYNGPRANAPGGSCVDMSTMVQGTVEVGTDGWVIGHLTNNSQDTLWVNYTFALNGVPDPSMRNAGGTTIQPGQTVGGEMGGLYSTNGDKNPPRIYWYAVLKSDYNQYGCKHNWQ
jgi:hypothetical protein